MARHFVTLDNFFDSGEVSGVGWNWSTAARTTDEVERTIPINYAFRECRYEAEGMNRNINVGAGLARTTATLRNLKTRKTSFPGMPMWRRQTDRKMRAAQVTCGIRPALWPDVRNYGFFIDLSHYNHIPGGGPPIPLLHDPAASRYELLRRRKQICSRLLIRTFAALIDAFPTTGALKNGSVSSMIM